MMKVILQTLLHLSSRARQCRYVHTCRESGDLYEATTNDKDQCLCHTGSTQWGKDVYG